jgi:hypothetical protein
MDEEQRKKLAQAGAMIGAAQGPLNLGTGGSIPAFPTNFSSINPEQRTNPIRFGGGGTAQMGLGGANVEYPSRLGLAGGNYGTRFQFGAEEFGPARLPQAQPKMLEQMYTNPFATPSQRMGENLSLGLTPVAPTSRLPIGEGPLSMNIAAPRSAEARGLQAIQTPRGTMYATEEQAANMMTPRTMAQQGTRSPAEQQALLAQMRERGQQIAQGYTETMQRFARSTIPEGVREREMPAPQGRFGQPLVSNFPRSREAMTQARQTVSPAAPMASFAPVQAPSPFIEDRFRNPFSSIYGFSA